MRDIGDRNVVGIQRAQFVAGVVGRSSGYRNGRGRLYWWVIVAVSLKVVMPAKCTGAPGQFAAPLILDDHVRDDESAFNSGEGWTNEHHPSE
jgi:hypothetical protein